MGWQADNANTIKRVEKDFCRFVFMEILSQSKTKLFASLLHKKYRYKQRLFLAEGIKCVQESLISEIPTTAYIVKAGFTGEITNFPDDLMYEATEEQFQKLTEQANPEGILAVIALPDIQPASGPFSHGPAILLDGLQDPGNVGAILRVAEWFGIRDILLGPGTVDPWHPKVVRASMGSLFRMTFHHIQDLPAWSHANASQLVVADLNGQSLSDHRPDPTAILVIGNEARGVSSLFRQTEGIQKIYIPGGEQTESLNAAVATGIVVWEWLGKGR